MKRFKAINSFFLKTTGKLVMPKELLFPETDEQVEEIEVFVKTGSCEEVVSKPKATADAPGAPPADPSDDLALVKGVGKATLEKLVAKGITTKTQLGEAVLDPAREEEMKEVLGANHGKILEQFSKPE